MMYPSIAMIITNSIITGNKSVMVSVMFVSADALEIAPRDRPTEVAILLNMFNSILLLLSLHRLIVLQQLLILQLLVLNL